MFHGIQIDPIDAQSAENHGARVEEILSFLRPKPCPYHFKRIGGDRDGAYLLPDDLEQIEACFSPGANNRKDFEDELLATFGIKSHMCDKSSAADDFKTPIVEGKQTFFQKWLDPDGNEDCISLADWVGQLAPGTNDLVLQMDIEGAEYRNLINCEPSLLSRFRVILIELHNLEKINDPAITARALLPFCSALGRDFTVVHAHPNNYGRSVPVDGTSTQIPQLLEVTLLRSDRISSESKPRMLTPQIPHPLDIAGNVLSRPPQFLDDTWRIGRNTLASEIHRVSIEADHLRREIATGLSRDAKDTRTIGTALTQLMTTMSLEKREAEDSSEAENIAVGKTYTLTSSYKGLPITGLVAARAPYFFHTDPGIGQAITIDLGVPHEIHKIVIHNRTDSHFDRASGLFAVLHDDDDPATGQSIFIEPEDDFLNGTINTLATILNPTVARYVTVTSPLKTVLHFSNLQIFGKQTPQNKEGSET